MVKVDLITGFLGTGKTTFIHRYIDYLSRKGQKVHVIENEFGSVSIDTLMLKEDDCEISDLSGACMCCTGKRMFKNMLVQAAEDGCDRILVEPSGIYDVDEFFETMFSEPVSGCCEIGSILTVVDARMDDLISDEAKYLMFSQLLAAGTVIVSKTQMFSEQTAGETVEKINALMEQMGSGRRFGEDVCRKKWDDFTDEDFEEFQRSGYQILEHDRASMQHDLVFMAKEMADYCENEQDLERRLRNLMENPVFGCVLRVKGHIQDLDGNWYEINCSRDSFSVRPCRMKRGLFVIIGQKLDEAALNHAFISRKQVKAGRKAADFE